MASDKGPHGRLSGEALLHHSTAFIRHFDLTPQLSLFVAEMFLSIGGFINGKWVQEGKLSVGKWCSLQGESKTDRCFDNDLTCVPSR